MLKSRIESKSGNNKHWKASPELFDGTIRSFGTDDRPSTELCRGGFYKTVDHVITPNLGK